MNPLDFTPPYEDGRHLFSVYVEDGAITMRSRDGVAAGGGTAYLPTVETAAAETRQAIDRAFALVKALPVEHYQPLSDALTGIVSAYQNEALVRLMRAAFDLTDHGCYDSVLILPEDWIQGVGDREEAE